MGELLQYVSFTEEEAAKLLELDSLEFGFFKPDINGNRQLLERAVAYLDGFIAQKVAQHEELRMQEESKLLQTTEVTDHFVHLCELREIYEKYNKAFMRAFSPRIYLLLGHYQLLLGLYDDALSAYNEYAKRVDEKGCQDLTYLYGYALCAFHFGALNRSILAFQKVLYLNPTFPRRKEILIKLGYIYKLKKDIVKSHRYFRQALSDESPCTWGPIEIRFQIGHLFEVCGRIKQARDIYEEINETIKHGKLTQIQHLCMRNLAWLYQSGCVNVNGAMGDPAIVAQTQKEKAIELLNKALELDNSDGRTWYLMGRCQAAVNRVQEAFRSYRSSIDKTEASADTWCSIGVLYQDQNQPMDALQAYFCAVQLDRCHITAWVNLGTLYESTFQYAEALKCYNSAINADKQNKVRPEIRARAAQLAQLLPKVGDKVASGDVNPLAASSGGAGVATAAMGSNPNKLPTVDQAWNLPIPFELTTRQVQLMMQDANRSHCSNFSTNGAHWARLIGEEALKLEDAELETEDTRTSPVAAPANQPAQEVSISDVAGDERTLEASMSANGSSCIPTMDEVSKLYTLMYQANGHSAAERKMCRQLYVKVFNYLLYKKRYPEVAQRLGTEDPFSSHNRQALKRHIGEVFANAAAAASSSASVTNATSGAVGTLNPDASSSRHGNGEEDPTDSSSQQQQQPPDDATVADLLAADPIPADLEQMANELFAELNGTADELMDAFLQNPPSAANGGGETSIGPPSGTVGAGRAVDQSTDGAALSTTGEIRNEGAAVVAESGDAGLSMMETSVGLEAANDRTNSIGKLTVPASPPKYVKALAAYLTRREPEIDRTTLAANLKTSMTAKEIIELMSGLGQLDGPWWHSLLPETGGVGLTAGVPTIPTPPEDPRPPCPPDRLLPATPCIYLEKRKDALDRELAGFCLDRPVAVLRGMASALRMDLSHFSTNNLGAKDPGLLIEIRTQPPAAKRGTRGLDVHVPANQRGPWSVVSQRSRAVISRFANYQYTSLRKAIRLEKQGLLDVSAAGDRSGARVSPGKSGSADADSSAAIAAAMALKNKPIRWGIVHDITEESKWAEQLFELNKLPAFFRLTSANNMLTHLGYPLIGVNTYRVYMFVGGTKMPGQQAANNVCTVSINVGPGDCEWYVVPVEYWGALQRLTESQGIDFLTDSWWPSAEEDLHESGIPFYSLRQRPGDLVWLGPGSVYWVHCAGWCNNIIWNVAPLSAGGIGARQYKLALERFEYCRLRGVKSPLPMMHLSWQLAKNFRGGDAELNELVRQTLLRTMVNSQLTMDLLEALNIDVRRHGKKPDDIAHYCEDCDSEVFNLLFVMTQEKVTSVRCLTCARCIDPTLRSFTVLSEYYMHELAVLYDNFQFSNGPVAAYQVSK